MAHDELRDRLGSGGKAAIRGVSQPALGRTAAANVSSPADTGGGGTSTAGRTRRDDVATLILTPRCRGLVKRFCSTASGGVVRLGPARSRLLPSEAAALILARAVRGHVRLASRAAAAPGGAVSTLTRSVLVEDEPAFGSLGEHVTKGRDTPQVVTNAPTSCDTHHNTPPHPRAILAPSRSMTEQPGWGR